MKKDYVKIAMQRKQISDKDFCVPFASEAIRKIINIHGASQHHTDIKPFDGENLFDKPSEKITTLDSTTPELRNGESPKTITKPVLKQERWCGDHLLKPGQKVYITYITTLLPAIVIYNDTTNHVVEYMIRDYYDNRVWDDDHLWLVYCHEALKRNN